VREVGRQVGRRKCVLVLESDKLVAISLRTLDGGGYIYTVGPGTGHSYFVRTTRLRFCVRLGFLPPSPKDQKPKIIFIMYCYCYCLEIDREKKELL